MLAYVAAEPETRPPLMSDQTSLLLGSGHDGPVVLRLRMANRHGLIAGATGTGKTVTLQVLAENFSRAGVPMFMKDVKADLAGLVKLGTGKALASVPDEKGSPTPVAGIGVLGSLLGGGSRRR
jgi:hypothetical protein